jgi:hypothetical protein
MTLRYRFLYRDLQVLERHIVRSETMIQSLPEYANLWIPKAHWLLHTAHDIWQRGPSRLQTTLMNEMKNSIFKLGVTRGNFLNPPRDCAEFYAKQSDYDLQNFDAEFGRSILKSDDTDIIISGPASTFHDSFSVRLLQQTGQIETTMTIEFLKSIQFHSTRIAQEDYILVDQAVYTVSRLIRTPTAHYMLLQLVAPKIQIDSTDGAYYVLADQMHDTVRLLSLSDASSITGLWVVQDPDSNRLHLVPKF